MVALTQTTVVHAPAGAVWQVVAGLFDRIGEWATTIPASAACPIVEPVPDAPVPARVCRTGMAMVPEVTETIVAFDATGRTLTYEATAGMPSFVVLARNQWRVTAEGEQSSRVTFKAELHVRGLIGWVARWLLLARVARTGRFLLDDLRHYVEHGVASPRKQRQLARAAVIGPGATRTRETTPGRRTPRWR